MLKVGIVIVNYNGEAYQNECMRSLYKMEMQDFEVVVVDSASSDNSIKKLREEFPQVHIIEMEENVGVAAGNNIGIDFFRKKKAEYILLLNNDIEVDTKLLTYLVEQASEQTVVVPKIYYFEPSNMFWFAGGALDWKKELASHWGWQQTDNGQFDKIKKITYSPTCCMLIHTSIFDVVGLIDETYFMYYDDTDFCARLEQAGIDILYVPNAKLWHKVSSSSGGSESKVCIYYMNRNQLYYMKKYRKKVTLYAKLYNIAVAAYRYLVLSKDCKNYKYIRIAYLDFILGKMGRKNF